MSGGVAPPALASDPQIGDGGTGAFYQWTGAIPSGRPRIVRAAARACPPLAFQGPVFLGIGLKDEHASPSIAFNKAKAAYALGSNIAIHQCPGLVHGPAVPRSQEGSIPWVRAAFTGRVPPGECQAARYGGDQRLVFCGEVLCAFADRVNQALHEGR